MKILSYHPFSLYANGGGSRILRRLYQGHEDEVTALIIQQSAELPPKGRVREIVVHASPVIMPWARWKLRNLLIWMRTVAFKPLTVKKVQHAAAKIDFDVLHVVNHDTFSAALCNDIICQDKQIWVSFHDHYKEIKSPPADTQLLWNRAHRRLVISDELGTQYQKEFGIRPYEVITDGVTAAELSEAATIIKEPVTIYFAGLLHITYLPLFKTLANALDLLNTQGKKFNLVLRGTQNLKFLNGRSFNVDYRPMTLNDAELKSELDASDLLYLPLKFTSPEFYLYSLSTKMVGYLAAPGTILYHGPADSAACKLLQQHHAGLCFTDLNPVDLANSIGRLISGDHQYSINAKKIAQKQFDMAAIRERFWAQQV
ncbi:glycosyltransferase [Mucilaginibacter sp.]|uniref:glycosyltransferase n=1 Tax=Mucilaginibacter sp. TaxID=1882438 RepID=UPI0035BC8C09